jgi:primosomal protein N''
MKKYLEKRLNRIKNDWNSYDSEQTKKQAELAAIQNELKELEGRYIEAAEALEFLNKLETDSAVSETPNET